MMFYNLLVNVLIFTTYLVECKQTLSETVLYYEPVKYTLGSFESYDKNKHLLKGTSSNVLFEFNAHGRTFKVELKRQSSLFTRDLVFNENESFHPANVYEGRLAGEARSYVHGFIHDGIFEGFIRCNDGSEFIIESSKQYKNGDNNVLPRSIIYRTRDYINVGPYKFDSLKAAQVDRKLIDFKSESESKSENAKISPAVNKRHKRSLSSDKRRACTIELLADPTFVEYHGIKSRAMYLMVQYLKTARDILEAVDFDGDGKPDKYTLIIKKISVIDTTPCSKNSSLNVCKYLNRNIEYIGDFLDISSMQNNSDICLSYVFCHRNFRLGKLGLAWQGFPDTTPGGICSHATKDGTGIFRTLNTGVVTNNIEGKVLSNVVTGKVLAHEIAHSFGSSHDSRINASCVPGGDDGNYLMYPEAQFKSGKNTFLLSACSKAEIAKNIEAKAEKGCFKDSEPVCGNKEVEPGEECDCGYEDEASCRHDPCCQGASPNGESGCKFTAKAKSVSQDKRCSPSLGYCCNVNTCSPHANNTVVCSQASECVSKKSMCIDTSFKCSKAKPVPERSVCNNGARTCLKGECVGSVCSLINKLDCQCSNQEELCYVCCRDRNSSSPCLRYSARTIQKPTGSLCNQDKGRCEASRCINYDEGEMLIMKLFNWFTRKAKQLYNWAQENWWACLLIVIVVLVIIILAVVYYVKRRRQNTNENNGNGDERMDELPLHAEA